MDWRNDFPTLKGIDKVVTEMAQRIMKGPLISRSRFWDGDIKIEDLNDYRAWTRFAYRIENERGAEGRALEIWETEISKIYGE